jgi:hypothetical protein
MKLLGNVIAIKFILILLSFNLEAEIQMQTLDSFEIQSLDSDSLVVSKVSSVVGIETNFIKESYLIKGLEDVMQQTKEMCKSFIPYEEVEGSETKFEIKV